MNIFRRLFKRNKPPPPVVHEERVLVVQNFRFLYKNADCVPKIALDYDSLKATLRKVHQVSEKWHLVYSTFKHGRSLHIMRDFQRQYTPPFLLVIQDCGDHVFGVLVEERLDVRKGVYGNRYTYLFKLMKNEGTFVKYEAVDNFVCHSTNGFIAFGCSDGYYGLLLNADMNSGESHTVDTFQNEVLGYETHFFIKEVELWSICL